MFVCERREPQETPLQSRVEDFRVSTRDNQCPSAGGHASGGGSLQVVAGERMGLLELITPTPEAQAWKPYPLQLKL